MHTADLIVYLSALVAFLFSMAAWAICPNKKVREDMSIDPMVKYYFSLQDRTNMLVRWALLLFVAGQMISFYTKM